MERLAGKKTYIVASVMIVYAVSGWLLGNLEQPEAWRLLMEAAAVAGLRNAIK
jgi:uncharacterized membrane-anchored protein YjiN (DUF445 family)